MSASAKQIALLLHLARMAHQIVARSPLPDLAGEDRTTAERAAALLRLAADTLQESLTPGDVV